ncbi:MAG TPA: hypothetical protein VFG10_13995 [Saprospiraceae bacterium]|nr:hypothetical protein [Saprospiraceae bacterium]
MKEDDSIGTKYQLEPQQYERMYFEEDIPLKDISRGLGPKLLGIGMIIFVVALIAANVVKFPDQLQLPFVLRGNERELVYSFPFPVYVKEVFVHSGDKVEKGQPLLRIASPEVASLIADLEGSTSKQTTFKTFTESAYQRQADILNQQILQLQARAGQLQKDINLLDDQWSGRAKVLDVIMAEAKDHAEAGKKLYADGIIARQELQEKERIYAQAIEDRSKEESLYQRERLLQQTNVETTMQSIASARLEKSRLDLDKAARSGDLESESASAGNLIERIFGAYRIENGSVVLLSPGAEVVSFVFEGDEEINPGVTVLKLNQSSQADYAFIKCPPSAAGKIKKNMSVNLKVSSFPYYEWGVVEGIVTSRSMSPDEKGEYNLTVSLDDQKRLKGMLFPGLDGTAVIILEEKTLFQYLFRDLAKVYHSATEGDFMKRR